MDQNAVSRIRRFNRAITREAGALDTSFLGRGRPLGAARVLACVGPNGTDVADIRGILGLDSGLLSRFLRRLESEGLVTTEGAPTDRRRRTAHLTSDGLAERAEYDRLNDAFADRMLQRLSGSADEALATMDLIANRLNRDRITIAPIDPEAPVAKACLADYFALLSERVAGISAAHVPDPDPQAGHYRPPVGTFLVAWSDGLPLGCVSLKTINTTTGEVKRLWIAPSARGMGLARRMMTAIEAEARTMGLTRLRLDTNAAQTAAITLYRTTGWQDAKPYSDFPATRWFEKRL